MIFTQNSNSKYARQLECKEIPLPAEPAQKYTLLSVYGMNTMQKAISHLHDVSTH